MVRVGSPKSRTVGNAKSMNPSDIEIDPMSAASPDLADEDMAALKLSISRLGQLVPIILYRGKILDGRKRAAVCRALGKEPLAITIPDDTSPADHVTAFNLLRTHYTTGQRAMYAAAILGLQNGSNRYEKKVGVQICTPTNPPINIGTLAETAPSRVTIAKNFGVPEIRISEARMIRRTAAPEIAAAVESGDISFYAAKEIVKHLPKEEQAAKVASIIATRKNNDGRTRARAGTIRQLDFKRAPKKDPIIIISKLLDNIAHSCAVLEEYVDAVKNLSDDSRPVSWTPQLNRIRKVLRLLSAKEGEKTK